MKLPVKLPHIPERLQPLLWGALIVLVLLSLAGPKTKTWFKTILSEIAWAALVGLAILTLFTGGPAWLGLAGFGLALRGTIALAALTTLVGTAIGGASGSSGGGAGGGSQTPAQLCANHGGVRLVAGGAVVCQDGFTNSK